jgi:hypothetical protein
MMRREVRSTHPAKNVRYIERGAAGDERCTANASGQTIGACGGVGSSARDAGYGKGIDLQCVGELLNIIRPIKDPPISLEVREPIAGPIDCDDAGMREAATWLTQSRSRSAVKEEDRETTEISSLLIREPSAVTEFDLSVSRRWFRHRRSLTEWGWFFQTPDSMARSASVVPSTRNGQLPPVRQEIVNP